jgi:Tryptophanyl-tRNA synthetase
LPENLTDAQKRPLARNLLSIFAALREKDTEEIISIYAGKEFSIFKKDLSELTSSILSPISKEMKKLLAEKQYLDSIIIEGRDKAIRVAEPVWSKVYKIMGFSNP